MTIRNLYLDYGNPGGSETVLNGIQSSTLQQALNWISGDAFALRLWFRQLTSLGSASTSVTLEAGSQIVLAAKISLTAETLLFTAGSFSAGVSGTDVYYEAACDLNTAELDAAMGAESSLSVYIDVEVQNAANTRRITWRFSLTITRQVYEGTESVPSSNLLPVAINDPPGGLQKCISGVWHIKNVDTGLWHPYWLDGSGPQLRFGPGVEA
jgi:hypothetical protein